MTAIQIDPHTVNSAHSDSNMHGLCHTPGRPTAGAVVQVTEIHHLAFICVVAAMQVDLHMVSSAHSDSNMRGLCHAPGPPTVGAAAARPNNLAGVALPVSMQGWPSLRPCRDGPRVHAGLAILGSVLMTGGS